MCQLVIGFQHFDMGLPWIPMHVLSTYALIMSQLSTVKYGIDFSVRKSVYLELFKKKKKMVYYSGEDVSRIHGK